MSFIKRQWDIFHPPKPPKSGGALRMGLFGGLQDSVSVRLEYL